MAETIDRSELEAKRQEMADRLSGVRTELDRLSRLALQLQGAIGGYDELLAPDIEDIPGLELAPDGGDDDGGS